MSYYAFDCDGTLAKHGVDYSREVGEPIAPMVELARKYLAEGHEVRIITARMSPEWGDQENQERMIRVWCLKHLGVAPIIQAHKSGGMIALYDDLAIGVIPDTGILAIDEARAIGSLEASFYIRDYDSVAGIESDPYVELLIRKGGDTIIAIWSVTGDLQRDAAPHTVTPREARCLAASLLRAADEAEKSQGTP